MRSSVDIIKLIFWITVDHLVFYLQGKYANVGLRRHPRDFYDHLDGDPVVVILALQFFSG